VPKQLQHYESEHPQQAVRAQTFVYPARLESSSEARAELRKTLCDWGFADIADDMLQCLAEAFANALLYGEQDQTVTVHVTTYGRTAHVEVLDSSKEQPQLHAPVEATTDKVPEASAVPTGGRGLLMIGAFSHRWGVRPLGVGKAVWFELTASQVTTA
jgi:anti-sigma regulatory factor (Ser/Thr protein kinase)